MTESRLRPVVYLLIKVVGTLFLKGLRTTHRAPYPTVDRSRNSSERGRDVCACANFEDEGGGCVVYVSAFGRSLCGGEGWRASYRGEEEAGDLRNEIKKRRQAFYALHCGCIKAIGGAWRL